MGWQAWVSLRIEGDLSPLEQARQCQEQEEVHEVLDPDGPGASEWNAGVEEIQPSFGIPDPLEAVAAEHYAKPFAETVEKKPSGPQRRKENQEGKHDYRERPNGTGRATGCLLGSGQEVVEIPNGVEGDGDGRISQEQEQEYRPVKP